MAKAGFHHPYDDPPESTEFRASQLIGRPIRIDAEFKERFGAKDIADSGNHRLVEQPGTDRDSTALEVEPGDLAIAAAQRIGPEPSFDLPPGRRSDDSALSRSVEIEDRGPPDQSHSNRATRFGRWRWVVAKFAITAEVDVDDPLTRKRVEKVLADRFDGPQRAPRHFFRVAVESALGAAHPEPLTGKPLRVVVRQPVCLVSLGHCVNSLASETMRSRVLRRPAVLRR